MAKSTSLMLPQNANTFSLKLTISDTTVAALCFTAGSNDSNVKAIIVSSDDTAAINLKVYVCRSGVDYLLGVVNIPVTAGSVGTVPAVDVLAALAIPGLPLDPMGKPYLPLKTGDTLKAGCFATMTTAKTCTVNVFGEDY